VQIAMRNRKGVKLEGEEVTAERGKEEGAGEAKAKGGRDDGEGEEKAARERGRKRDRGRENNMEGKVEMMWRETTKGK